MACLQYQKIKHNSNQNQKRERKEKQRAAKGGPSVRREQNGYLVIVFYYNWLHTRPITENNNQISVVV
jgi:hypothetical protein